MSYTDELTDTISTSGLLLEEQNKSGLPTINFCEAYAAIQHKVNATNKASAKGQQHAIKQFLRVLDCLHVEERDRAFLWAKVPQLYSNGTVFSTMLLRDLGIFVAPGNVLGPLGEHYILVSANQNESIVQEAISRVVRNGFI